MSDSSPQLQVGGFVPFTTIDYPGKLSAVVFCQGCPWRCSYCHNAHLQRFGSGNISWSVILEKLSRRRGLLDAVVFSGGEPTAQAALLPAVREVRRMGFLAGLHTAGIYPARLAEILPDVNWIGLDVKAPFDHRHDVVTGIANSWHSVKESVRLVTGSGVQHEIRTTADPAHLDEAAREAVRQQLCTMEAKPTRWQTWRPPVTNSKSLSQSTTAAI